MKRAYRAVLLDIDTEGEEPYGGLAVLNELRSLNEDFDADFAEPRARSVGGEAGAQRRG